MHAPNDFFPADGNNWIVCELLEELRGALGNKATHNRALSIHIVLHEVGVLKPSKRITILLAIVVRTLLCEALKKGWPFSYATRKSAVFGQG